MAADQQRLAAGVGMDLHQRPQHVLVALEAQPPVVVRSLFRNMADLALAVVQRMVGVEALDPGLGRSVERVVGGTHVGPAGVAADRRHDLGAEHRALGLDRLEGRIGVPALVALEDLDDVVAPSGARKVPSSRTLLTAPISNSSGPKRLAKAICSSFLRNWPGKISRAYSSQVSWNALQVGSSSSGRRMPVITAPKEASTGWTSKDLAI